jgi:thiosulfate/3-mercaptopyruvate sulfurtransferase
MAFTTLVTAPVLLENLSSPDWLILDVRHDLAAPEAGRAAWQAGHIPGAFFLHMDRDLSAAKTGRNGRHPLPEKQDFAALLASLGAGPHTQIIAYDAQGGMMAARLWWMLRWIGHEAVAVLDGGIQAWQTINGPLETQTPSPKTSGSLAVRESLVATVSAEDVLQNLKTQARLVVDARAPDRFRGENETMDPVGGHIPGAANRFFKDNLLDTGTFKPAAQLRAEFQQVFGRHQPAQVIVQCGSGVTACHNLLALEIAGLREVALYPGSWSEWCSDPARPVAKG